MRNMMKQIVVVMVCMLLLVSGWAVSAEELIIQLMADSPQDKNVVEDAINEVLSRELDVTVKFQNLTWTDYQQRYRMLLASGEPVDLLYAASWNAYAEFARDGAYLELDELLPKVVPALWEAIPKADWDGVRVNGKIYTVPDLYQSYSGSYHVMYREDLRKKYGVPEITDLATMEQYFDAIKANEPSMYPCNNGNLASWMPTLFRHMVRLGNPESAWIPIQSQAKEGALYRDHLNPRTPLRAPWEFPEYMEFLKLVKRWGDKGFWSEDILSEKNISQDLFEVGKSACGATGFNVDKTQKYFERINANSPDWELGEFSWDRANGFSVPAAAQQDTTAVPLQSRDPEKALQVIEAFLMNEELQHLVHYGIKDKHYTVTEAGEYQQLDDSGAYGIFGMNAWAWKNNDLLLKQTGGWGAQHRAYYEEYGSIAVPNFGFAINLDPIEAEMTAVTQVIEQYAWPLWAGVVDDIEAGQALLEQKLQDVGYDKVQAEVNKQFQAYLDEIGHE